MDEEEPRGVCGHELLLLGLVDDELLVGLGFAAGLLVGVVVEALGLLFSVLVELFEDVHEAAVELEGLAVGEGDDEGGDGDPDSIIARLVVFPLVAADGGGRLEDGGVVVDSDLGVGGVGVVDAEEVEADALLFGELRGWRALWLVVLLVAEGLCDGAGGDGGGGALAA